LLESVSGRANNVTRQIDLMFHVTTLSSLNVLVGLCNAAQRNGCRWAMFLTNDAVTLATEPRIQSAIGSAEKVVVCDSSWEMFAPEQMCPVDKGSQTSNSEMISFANRVVSL